MKKNQLPFEPDSTFHLNEIIESLQWCIYQFVFRFVFQLEITELTDFVETIVH